MSKISCDPIPLFVMQKKSIYLFFLLIALITFNRCANPVSPTGGPKDTQPPEVLKCYPPNFSPFFHGEEIKIEFDEFVELETGNNQIIISPPWLPNTDYKLRGKSIVIKLDDTLHTNTTYSFNFGNTISDITEKNVLQNFTYVFSTGAYVDSLSIEGRIIDAFDLSPQKNVLAMLYVDDNDTIPFDSLPYKVRPFYLTRTNENGEFRLGNLSVSPFKLFALKDINNDFLYNLPDEKIAFSDSLVKGAYFAPSIPDTVQSDSLDLEDSLTIQPEKHLFFTMRLFQYYDSIQRILKSKVIQDDQIGIYFRYPTIQPQFIPLNFSSQTDWKIEEINKNHDTIFMWLKQVPVDSLILQVTDNGKIIDTLEIDLMKKKEKDKDGKKEGTKPKRLKINTNTSNGFLNQYTGDLVLRFSYPLTRYDFSSVSLIDHNDTVKPGLVMIDSIMRAIKVLHKWKEEGKYRIIIPDSSFYSINDLTNDSVIIPFKTRMAKEFGSLKLKIDFKTGEGPFIIQLLNEKDAVAEQRILNGPEKIEFTFISAGKYKLKAIRDGNKNHRWDTGDYLNKLQPEEVFIFPKTIEIRANWDVEETWSL